MFKKMSMLLSESKLKSNGPSSSQFFLKISISLIKNLAVLMRLETAGAFMA
jgi:hypothetical protein